jgi:UDP-2,3-diacylglucosamine pyrophosphatase LpxH
MKLGSLLGTVVLACLLSGVALPADAASGRSVIAVSDLHVGAGMDASGKWKPFEDFRWDADFSGFLNHLSATYGDKVDLVLAGDVFELWQSPTMICSSDLSHPGCEVKDCVSPGRDLSCSEADAVARLKYVLDHHPQFVALLKSFAAKGQNRIYIVPGNHDAALLFPKVAELLRSYFPALPIRLETAGYWLSEDGLIYADHGHQFDPFNKFSNWPAPFEVKNGIRYISKPWGENMVKEFYEQYEYIFPTIDNLGSDLEGIKYGLARATKLESSVAVANLLRFLIVLQSFRQRLDLLGDDKPSVGSAKWDYEAIRQKPATFYIDTLGDEPAMKAAAESLLPLASQFDGAAWTREEIDQICRKKKLLNESGPTKGEIATCPWKDPTMGAIAGMADTDYSAMRAYLVNVLPLVAGARPALADLYIYGHTHQAVPEKKLKLGDTSFGYHQIKFINTGAFQRVATLDKVNQIAATKGASAVLNPEDLPACYTYVLVSPYADKPASQLRTWSQGGDQLWSSAAGRCLD